MELAVYYIINETALNFQLQSEVCFEIISAKNSFLKIEYFSKMNVSGVLL